MVLGAGPEWNYVLERPGKVFTRGRKRKCQWLAFFDIKRRARRYRLTVSGMGIDGLEKTEGDPDVDGDYVQVWLDPAVEQRSKNCPCSEDHDFERMCVLGGETERCGILVVELVNVFVKQGRVEELMSWRK
jgi:hypothetical protein